MLDLAPITRHLRAKASSHLLVAAVHHLNVLEVLSAGPLTLAELQKEIGLKERPAMVLFPALCAMEIIGFDAQNRLALTELGSYLTTANPNNLIGYAALEKDDSGVLKFVQWLRNDGPENVEGMSYVKDNESDSPMDEPEAAHFFTMALAGRARYLAPVVAKKMSVRSGHLLDVAGGTGYYTYEWLIINQEATATIFDRPEVLKTSAALLEELSRSGRDGAGSLKERVRFEGGDMLRDELPPADILLAASLFHDWPTPTCESLAKKFAAALRPGGELWVHDSFLNDSLDGPLAVTDYSAMLFLGTRGRAYSRKEYRQWLSQAGLQTGDENIPTLMDYGLIYATKKL